MNSKMIDSEPYYLLIHIEADRFGFLSPTIPQISQLYLCANTVMVKLK